MLIVPKRNLLGPGQISVDPFQAFSAVVETHFNIACSRDRNSINVFVGELVKDFRTSIIKTILFS